MSLGQFLAAVSCVLLVFGTLYSQLALARVGAGAGKQDADAVAWMRLASLVGGGVSVCMSAAMYIVFGRAKSLETIAVRQEVENEKIWHAVQALQSAVLRRGREVL
ncbi:MAG: hypothetical protein ACRC33_05110 [Gemmataceae bacterium]